MATKERAKRQKRKSGAASEDDEEEEAAKPPPAKRAATAAAEESDSSDSDAEMAGDGNEEEEEDGPASGDRPHYVTPNEAEEIMRRLWEREWEILSLIYQGDVAAQGALAAGKRVLPPRPMDSTASSAAVARFKEGFRMFFLRCLSVAPNKFRPVSRLGDDVYEHAQNTLLQKVLNLAMDVGQNAQGEDADLGRAIRSWLQLQLAVNNLMDSNMTEERNPEVNGIKQVLEKKEGLFRKNMMGKRVNFAARSVISPDPYISG